MALSQGQIFERRLKILADQIRQISSHAAQQFDILQRIYLDALRKVNCPKQYLPEVLVYSPLDPERVYAQFYLNAQKAVVASLDFIENEIQQYCSQIRQKLLMEDIGETVQELF